MGAEESTVSERIYEDEEESTSRRLNYLAERNEGEEEEEKETSSWDNNSWLFGGVAVIAGLAAGAGATALYYNSQNQKYDTSSESAVISYPRDWSIKKLKEHEEHFNIVDCKQYSKEFNDVRDLMCRTLPNIKIKSLQRIENKRLYESFAMKKLQMERKHTSDSLNVKRLFHGTIDQNVDSICYQGFDVRLNGERIGSRYGKGMYFAKDSKFSDDYCESNGHGYKKMFLAKVLAGKYVLGHGEYKRPPCIGSSHELYDSCVNDINNPIIFVIFDSTQVYPEYLIEYC